MDFQAEYRSKLRTPAEAVRAVKNGDWVDYTSGLGFPPLLDAALAARRDELHDVKVRGNLWARCRSSSATRSRRIFSTTPGTARRMSAGSATAACATSRR